MSEWNRPYRKDANYWTRVFPDILTRYVNLDWAVKWSDALRTWRDPVTGRAVGKLEGKRRREVYHRWNTIHRIEEGEARRGNIITWREAQEMYYDAIDQDSYPEYQDRELNLRRLVS